MEPGPSSDDDYRADVKNVLSGYMSAKRNEIHYDSEISESENLDEYDEGDTFLVNDEFVEEIEDDFDEESILSDPSDLFDGQTESEPESEPEVIYKEKKIRYNTFIDNEAEEDEDEEEEDDGDFYDHSAAEAIEDDESDYEGPCNREINGPLNASDYVDEEAIEHNDLCEMYPNLIGKEELPDASNETISIDDSSINHPSCSDFDSSSPTELPVGSRKASKRRRVRVLESDDEAPNSPSPSVSKSPDIQSDSPFKPIAKANFIDSPATDSPIVVKKKRRKVLESDGEMSTGRKPLKPLAEPQVIVLNSSTKKGPSDPTSSPGLQVVAVDSPVVVKRKRHVRKLILESDEEDEEVVAKAADRHHQVAEESVVLLENDAASVFDDSLREPRLDLW